MYPGRDSQSFHPIMKFTGSDIAAESNDTQRFPRYPSLRPSGPPPPWRNRRSRRTLRTLANTLLWFPHTQILFCFDCASIWVASDFKLRPKIWFEKNWFYFLSQNNRKSALLTRFAKERFKILPGDAAGGGCWRFGDSRSRRSSLPSLNRRNRPQNSVPSCNLPFKGESGNQCRLYTIPYSDASLAAHFKSLFLIPVT